MLTLPKRLDIRESSQHLRAALVCVDYADYLVETLPRNIHHFKEVLVVTSSKDELTQKVVQIIASKTEVPIHLYVTDSFYDDGATFNKWKGFEEGLTEYGRSGWMCLMDADIVWPTVLPSFELEFGFLYGPLRRMWHRYSPPIPEEVAWTRLPIHRNFHEWPGYTQIFHASDPSLPAPPWHDTKWKHAGGADSFFQIRWNPTEKIRLPFEVLHIGQGGVNWMGRTSPYFQTGDVPEQAEERLRKLQDMFHRRREAGPDEDRFHGEKIVG